MDKKANDRIILSSLAEGIWKRVGEVLFDMFNSIDSVMKSPPLTQEKRASQ
jgi:hypothetical protein